jgi:hypothetical protein
MNSTARQNRQQPCEQSSKRKQPEKTVSQPDKIIDSRRQKSGVRSQNEEQE